MSCKITHKLLSAAVLLRITGLGPRPRGYDRATAFSKYELRLVINRQRGQRLARGYVATAVQ